MNDIRFGVNLMPNGWSDELPFQQRFRDVFGYQIGDGTAQIQKHIIVTRLIGSEVRDR
ncbi:MAG TPA: acyl-CoA dehydrogenase family protein [Jatrophihabitantaceae bacterium]|jgi:cyclohexanecarboxyl-CoA dehydrogenase